MPTPDMSIMGSLHAGTDHTHVNHLLSTLNVPTISHKVYKVREREVGHSVESVAKESCKNVNCVENINNCENEDGVVEIAGLSDMGWQKSVNTKIKLESVLGWWLA